MQDEKPIDENDPEYQKWLAHFEGIEREANRVLSKEEVDARLAICRTCGEFTEYDPTKDGMATCDKCRNCTTKIIRWTLARWKCPMGKWEDAMRPESDIADAQVASVQTAGKGPAEWEVKARPFVCEACDFFIARPEGKIDTCGVTGNRIDYARGRCEKWENWTRPAVGVMPLEALWRLHDRKTFLVIGRGPSAQHSSVNLAFIDRDITIGCNVGLWTPEKQRETKIDYNLSVDEVPCWKPMPDGIKLISNANTDKGIAARKAHEELFWCVFRHQGFDWKYLRYGRPIPTAFNSGIAAVSLALYMGAREVKIIGIDYAKVPEVGGMHTNDADDEARKRTERDFDRTFGRVQKGAHRIAVWCKIRGVKLTVLARESRLQWTPE